MDENELPRLRGEMDELDARLLGAFLERMRLAGEIGAYKAARGLPIRDAAREEAILARVRAAAGERDADGAEALWRLLLRLSRERQAGS